MRRRRWSSTQQCDPTIMDLIVFLPPPSIGTTRNMRMSEMWIEKGGQTVRAKFLCFLAAQEIRKTTARWRRFTAALPLSSGVNNQKPGEYIYRMSNKTRFTSQVSEKSWEKLAIKGSTAISLKTNEMVVAPSITTAIKAECPDIRRCNYIFRYGGNEPMPLRYLSKDKKLFFLNTSCWSASSSSSTMTDELLQ